MSEPTTVELQQQIDLLHAELSAMRDQLAALRPVTPLDVGAAPGASGDEGDATADAPDSQPGPFDRRHLLRAGALAAGAAVGGAALTIATAAPAAASAPYTGNGTNADGLVGTTTSVAPGTWAGVHGTTDAPNSYGVQAENTGGGTGLWVSGGGTAGVLQGDNVGVDATAVFAPGTGVRGQGPTYGVTGNQTSTDVNGAGVKGTATNAAGVQGIATSGIGVHGKATNGRAVVGESTSGAGLYGSSSSAAGVIASSASSYGVDASSTTSSAIRAASAGVGQATIAASNLAATNNGIGIRASGHYGVWGSVTAQGGPPTTGLAVYGDATTCTSTSDNYGVKGASTVGTGVEGTSVSGVGVSAIAGSGLGVFGISTDGVGVAGQSTNSLGINGNSLNGIGLRANGGKANALLLPVGASPPARADAHVAGEIIEDANSELWVCVVNGTPGTWRRLAGPGTLGSLAALAVPVRIVDTRQAGGIMVNETRVFDATTKVGGGASGVPAGATATAVNFAVTNTNSGGFGALWTNPVAWPGTANINWGLANQTLSNSVLTAVDATGAFQCKIAGTAHVILDVVGYYR